MPIPSPANMSVMRNITGIVDLMVRVDDNIMHNSFGALILLTLWLICFFAFQRTTDHSMKSFTASSFISFLLSLLLMSMGLINTYWVYGLLVLTAIGVALLQSKD